MQKNVIVLHHNDRDGYVSAAVCLNYLQRTGCSVQFKEVTYSEPLISCMKEGWVDMVDVIIIVDYSISTKENIEFMEKYAEKITWIDHHKSSIDVENTHAVIKAIPGYRIVGISGAALCWLYFEDTNSTNHKYLSSFMNISPDRVLPSVDVAALTVNNPFMPVLIKYTHRYDTWDLDNDVINFNFGYNKENINNIAYDIYNTSDALMMSYLMAGDSIKSYVVSESESIIRQTAKEFEMHIPLEYKDISGSYSVLAVNMQKPSSLKFGIYASQYDILMPFSYNGKSYTYSLYTTKPTVDCAKIAELFGGGGHKSAAGFCLDKNIIEDVEDNGKVQLSPDGKCFLKMENIKDNDEDY